MRAWHGVYNNSHPVPPIFTLQIGQGQLWKFICIIPIIPVLDFVQIGVRKQVSAPVKLYESALNGFMRGNWGGPRSKPFQIYQYLLALFQVLLYFAIFLLLCVLFGLFGVCKKLTIARPLLFLLMSLWVLYGLGRLIGQWLGMVRILWVHIPSPLLGCFGFFVALPSALLLELVIEYLLIDSLLVCYVDSICDGGLVVPETTSRLSHHIVP